MNHLRVAHVVHGFDVGGLERVVARLVNGLDSRFFENLIICFGPPGKAARWIRDGKAEIVSLPKREGNDARLVSLLTSLLRDRQVHIVHSHDWGTLLETAWARWRAGVDAHVHGLHGAPLVGPPPGWLRDRLRALATRWVLGRVDAVTAVSESVRLQYSTWCSYPRERMQVIANGVDSVDPASVREARKASRARLGISDTTTVIGSVGRLEPVKGFDLALEAMACLLEQGCDIFFLLMGGGSAEPELRHQAERLQISGRLRFISDEVESLPWLAAMDIYLNCSRSEGMSQSILEAMAVGLPLVVTHVGENARLVGREEACGRVVDAEDRDALITGILALLPGDLRARCSDRSRERHRQRFQTAGMLDAYAHLYRRVMHRPEP